MHISYSSCAKAKTNVLLSVSLYLFLNEREMYYWGPSSPPKVLQAKTPSARRYTSKYMKIHAEVTIERASA
jgi:hypothetical protein